MATTKKKLYAAVDKGYVVTKHASAVLGSIWEHWVKGLGHTEAAAEKKMKTAINNLHKAETKKKPQKSAKKKAPKTQVRKKTVRTKTRAK